MAWKKQDNSKLKEKAKKLRRKGLSYLKIGKLLGRCHSTIMYWISSDYHKKQNKLVNKWMQKQYSTDKKFRETMIRSNIKQYKRKIKSCKAFQKQRKNYSIKRYKILKKFKRQGKIIDHNHKSCKFCKSKNIRRYNYNLRIRQDTLITRYFCNSCKKSFL